MPSFQTQQVGSSSFDSIARPAGLRGLSGVHVLMLVNGKQRRNSALIDLNTGDVSAGANPVDLDLIPASAIERMEVLRDGATAQHGSDAITGHQGRPREQRDFIEIYPDGFTPCYTLHESDVQATGGLRGT